MTGSFVIIQRIPFMLRAEGSVYWY